MANNFNYNYIFKYIIIGAWRAWQPRSLASWLIHWPGATTCSLLAGDMGVGKSCLLHQFTDKKCTHGSQEER